MEEYNCKARPNMSSTIDTNNISSYPNDKYFKIEFDYRKTWVSTDTKHQCFGDIQRNTLHNLSIDKLMQQTTIESWLSHINAPKDAFWLVVEEILQCARDMVNGTYKNLRFLCIQVDFSVSMAFEEDSCDEGDYEEEIEVEEEDNGLVPPISRAIESESYEDDYGYEGNNGLEEDEEEMEVDEEDNRFVPAAKSCIEGLEMVKVEEVEKCAICFEDFNVGVSISCSHMFHKTCIRDWLSIGNSCPLCRFQLPT